MNGGFLLHNRSSSRASQLFKLTKGTYSLGRSLDCDFVVCDETISRRHAEITVDERCVRVRDLKSRNGTFVDGKRVSECAISPGDQLRFGQVTFQLNSPEGEGQNLESGEETASCGNSEEQLASGQIKFSPAENRVFALLLDGLSEKGIGRHLHLSRHTIHNHVRAIYRILSVHSRAELLGRFVKKNAD